jgi:Complex1_LYR-like
MGRLEQLSLFRRVMRLHQRKLPAAHRGLGDRYVRQEFRAMGNPDRPPNPQQEAGFMQEWHDYIAHLEVEADLLGVGRDLADGVVESLSDDQRLQLQKLREHTLNIEGGK